MSQAPSQEPRPNQTLLIKVQSRETENSRSIHSSDNPEQSMLYIQLRSISEDTRDLELCPKHPHKNLDLTKHYLYKSKIAKLRKVGRFILAIMLSNLCYVSNSDQFQKTLETRSFVTGILIRTSN